MLYLYYKQDKHNKPIKILEGACPMHKVGETELAKKETLNIIEHLVHEDVISFDEYDTLHRLVELLERKGVRLKLEEM